MTTVLVKPQPAPIVVAGAQIPANLTARLSSLLPAQVFGYEWFASTNRQRAMECVQTILTAANHQADDRVRLFAGMLADLYHQDRAEHASSFLPGQPRSSTKVPERVWVDSAFHNLSLRELSVWPEGMPADRFSAIARIERETWPDCYYLGTLERVPDPILFARFGAWYLKLAQWE
jgi:hypothetical protein